MDALTHRFVGLSPSPLKIYIAILALAILSGAGTGYILASSHSNNPASVGQAGGTMSKAQQDNTTFKDFAEGTIQKKPDSTYGEGTHLLVRANAVPVALTSSVVDLSQYEGKKVKVFGETQKAIKEGWLMDVGKVEVQ